MSSVTYVALAIAAGVILTMPVFAIVARNRPMDADVARRPTTILLGYWVRDWLRWLISPIERALVALKVSPDVFNFAGMFLGLLAGIAFVRGSLAVAGWMIILGGLCDIFDGRIARARGLSSPYGEFLDSMLDRFAETFAFMGLAVYFAPSMWAVLATALALGASLMVSYARAKGAVVGVDCRGGVMARAERLVLLALAALLDGALTTAFGWRAGTVLLAAVCIIGVGALGTAAYRTWYIARELK
ncbi:MAG TPA: CDP-alcohol phosphatidyltransferase family protein [Gemmatimonadaceae bacterium]|nr:CDP-alcohol phosphatidyltransferase family protein [Gemmatimonadaceae bacterium]